MKTISKMTKAFIGMLLGLYLIPFGQAVAADFSLLGTFTYSGGGATNIMAVNPATQQVYISGGMGQQGLIRINAANPGNMTQVTLSYGGGIAVDKTTGRYATTNGYGGILYVFNPDDTLYNSVGISGCGGDLDADPATGRFFVSTQCNDHIAVYSQSTMSLLANFAAGGVGSSVVFDPGTGNIFENLTPNYSRGGVTAPLVVGSSYGTSLPFNGYVMAADGVLKRLYVYDNSGNLLILDSTTFATLHTYLSSGYGQIAADTALGRFYTATGNTITAYDANTFTQITTFTLPVTGVWGYIAGMRMAPGDNRLYAIDGSNLYVIQTGVSNQPPVANAGTDQNIYLGQTAFLNGSTSSDPDGDPLTYVWTLDSAPAGSNVSLLGFNTSTPSLFPDVSGVYHVSLIVNDGTTNSDVTTVTINVSWNLPPIAVATATPTSGNAPLQVLFNSSASHDPENSILTYSWDFGDPASASNISTTMNPIHAYAAVGNYTAVVTVTDGLGMTGQASVDITVTAPNLPLTVSPSASPNNGAAPLNVQFDANATDANPGDVLSYSWNFGDGSAVSTLSNPQHSYAAGTYTAVVTVSDGVNAPVSASLTISAGSALTINVTEAKVERGEKGKMEGKIRMKAEFDYAGLPAAGDIILVKFDGITLLNVPFASFHQDHSGRYEYESRRQEAKIDFNSKTIKVSSHKMQTGQVNNSNGIDVVVSFGTATGTDNFVMSGRKGEKGDRDSDLSHKKNGRHDKDGKDD